MDERTLVENLRRGTPLENKAADEIVKLRKTLKLALRQWEMYADMFEARVDFCLAKEQSPEADMYREAVALSDGDAP